MNRRWAALLSAAVSALLVAGIAVRGRRSLQPRDALEGPTPSTSPATSLPAPTLRALPHPARWVAFGGGGEPSSNPVSIENDLALAGRAFGPGGVMLFAGGPESEGVYELTERSTIDEATLVLADLLSPHGGRDGRYRRTHLAAHGPATRDAIVSVLERELAEPAAPLLVYVDAHGDGAEAPLDNRIVTWGGDALTVRELIAGFDRARRPLRIVLSTCFSGGLAEMVFREGRPELGATDADRCGLFASTWDLEATGCDPDPDRRSHEGYAVHFLSAISGKDPSGRILNVDLDRDGRVSLLEAHSYARIVSRGMDVPTTTSERWLRAVAPTSGAGDAVALPEDDAVITTLAESLGMSQDDGDPLERARARLDALEREYERRALEEERLARELEIGSHAARGDVLARWPALEDPWHPAFGSSLARDREAIVRFIRTSPSFAAYRRAREASTDAADATLDVALERAPVERLVRALENRALAARLKHRGGADWIRYERFLACERSPLP